MDWPGDGFIWAPTASCRPTCVPLARRGRSGFPCTSSNYIRGAPRARVPLLSQTVPWRLFAIRWADCGENVLGGEPVVRRMQPQYRRLPSVGTGGMISGRLPQIPRRCHRLGLRRELVHTGVLKTNDQIALIKSISREHAQVVFAEGSDFLTVTRLGPTPIAVDNGPGTPRTTLTVKHDTATIDHEGGRIHLNNASNEATYEIRSLPNFLQNNDLRDDLHDLLVKMNAETNRTINMLMAQLHSTKQRIAQLELDQEVSFPQHDSSAEAEAIGGVDGLALDDNEREDLYGGQTQAY